MWTVWLGAVCFIIRGKRFLIWSRATAAP